MICVRVCIYTYVCVLLSVDITAFIRNKDQFDDLKVEQFNFPYAREVSSF